MGIWSFFKAIQQAKKLKIFHIDGLYYGRNPDWDRDKSIDTRLSVNEVRLAGLNIRELEPLLNRIDYRNVTAFTGGQGEDRH